MVPAPQSRVAEMLDSIRGEFDQLAQELYLCKSQRDDFELKSKHSFFHRLVSKEMKAGIDFAKLNEHIRIR